jgi:DNA gyrase subunit A
MCARWDVRARRARHDDRRRAERDLHAGVEERELSVLTATENGFGKRTRVTEYPKHGRGTKGMMAIQTSERNGKVVGAVLVETSDEIMLISTGGVLIRTKVADIREMGRSTQGVTLINLDDGTRLAGVEKVIETEDDDPAERSPVAEE